MKKLLNILMLGAFMGTGLSFGAEDYDPSALAEFAAQHRIGANRLNRQQMARSQVQKAYELKNSITPAMLKSVNLKKIETAKEAMRPESRYSKIEKYRSIVMQHFNEMHSDDVYFALHMLDAAETLSMVYDIQNQDTLSNRDISHSASLLINMVGEYLAQRHFM